MSLTGIESVISPQPELSTTTPRTFKRVPSTVLENKDVKYASVLKIFVSTAPPTFRAPWRLNQQQNVSGSGFYVNFQGNNYILTNAHVAEYSTDLLVRKPSSPTKYPAQLKCISQELDLAILQVKNEKFFHDLHPLEFKSEVPQLDEDVTVIGYPTGDDAICVTRGVVSRITMQSTRESCQHVDCLPDICQIQIDAAINSGNSGGPVFDSKNKVVGVARASSKNSENQGFIIAVEHVLNFLMDYEEHGTFQGVPDLGLKLQTLENLEYREFVGLPPDVEHGIVITHVCKLGTCAEALKENDVILSIDDTEIGQDGTVQLATNRTRERVSISRTVAFYRIGEELILDVFRDGEISQVFITLKRYRSKIRSEYLVDHFLQYHIFGGFVFTVLSAELIQQAIDMKDFSVWGYIERESTLMLDDAEEQMVCISDILTHPINHGYGGEFKYECLKEINGTKPKNLKHSFELVHEKEQTVLTFRKNYKVVMNRDRASLADEILMKTFKIVNRTSEKLLSIEKNNGDNNESENTGGAPVETTEENIIGEN